MEGQVGRDLHQVADVLPWSHLGQAEHPDEKAKRWVKQFEGLALGVILIKVAVDPANQRIELILHALLVELFVAAVHVGLPEQLRLDQLKVFESRIHRIVVPRRMNGELEAS